MKNFLFLITALWTSISVQSQTSTNYLVEIDLTKTANDQVPVTVYPPTSDSAFVEYHMAKVVPGTYSISDFGRFVTDMKAFDASGDSLKVENLTTNRWKIENNGKLHKITYKVHDTFDRFEGYGTNIVFEPGGTNIAQEDKAYVMNTFGFVGYIDGLKMRPYRLKVLHDESIYGSTALKRLSSTSTEDIFIAEDFNFLADGPILYCEPDTTSRMISNANVLVSVFSPNKVLSAEDVMQNINDLMIAQADYLGGELPVDRYAYLIYLMDDVSLSGSMGALEHSYSSVYTLPEAAADRIAQTVRDVASHEFFHIVTPLNIHSEEIGNFNYIDPEMSKHLWLYEGVTEYSSMHVQVKYDLYSPEKFLEEIQDKLRTADEFPNVSFTHMSEHILEEEYEPMYVNVYYKGALIAMCLDLYLLKYSDGQYDLQALMRDLAKKYGKTQSFEDDKLFDVITDLTYPEIGTFLTTYVEGDTPLPIEEALSWVGIEYEEDKVVEDLTLGKIGIAAGPDERLMISDVSQMNEFGIAMGYEEGDILVSLMGDEISIHNAQDILMKYNEETKAGDKVKVVVLRENDKGKLKKTKLKAKAITVKHTLKHNLQFVEDPSQSQEKLLKAWINSDIE